MRHATSSIACLVMLVLGATSLKARAKNLDLLGIVARQAEQLRSRVSFEPDRWRIVGLSSSGFGRGFDPRLHSPNIVNVGMAITYEENGRVQRIAGGLCAGLSAMTHVYYRLLTAGRERNRKLLRAFRTCFFPGSPIPGRGERLRNLRAYTRSSQARRERAASVAAAMQKGGAVTAINEAKSAEEFYQNVRRAIRRGGTCLMTVWYLKPAYFNKKRIGHTILAYAIRRATVQKGNAPARQMLAIQFWDPNSAYRTPGVNSFYAEPPADQEFLLYDPQDKTLSFTASYLRRSNGSDSVTFFQDSVQHSETLVVGRDIQLRTITRRDMYELLKNGARIRPQTNVNAVLMDYLRSSRKTGLIPN